MNRDGGVSEWETVETFDISDDLTSGKNTISIRVVNHLDSGSSTTNPAGLIFKANLKLLINLYFRN